VMEFEFCFSFADTTLDAFGMSERASERNEWMVGISHGRRLGCIFFHRLGR